MSDDIGQDVLKDEDDKLERENTEIILENNNARLPTNATFSFNSNEAKGFIMFIKLCFVHFLFSSDGRTGGFEGSSPWR